MGYCSKHTLRCVHMRCTKEQTSLKNEKSRRKSWIWTIKKLYAAKQSFISVVGISIVDPGRESLLLRLVKPVIQEHKKRRSGAWVQIHQWARLTQHLFIVGVWPLPPPAMAGSEKIGLKASITEPWEPPTPWHWVTRSHRRLWEQLN